MTQEDLQAEVERLRAELEAYRRRDNETLRTQLAEAMLAAQHYRQEAERNAAVGREIAADAEKRIYELRSQLDTARAMGYGIRGRPIASGA